jgi:membrane fusion protein (multidrug efflux system)
MNDEEKNQNNQAGEADQQSNENSEDNGRGLSQTRKNILFGILAVVIIVGLIFGWRWFRFSRSHESTRDAHIEGHISPVIPRVNGYIAKVYVRDNEKVKKGQIVAQIDTSEFQIKVKQAKAALAGAKANYQSAKAHLGIVKSQKDQAKVSLEHSDTELNRQKRLFKDHSTTQQKLDQAKYVYQSAKTKYETVQRQIKSAGVNIQTAQAQIKKYLSALNEAKLHLSYTALKAPISGRISEKDIEAGQYVRSGNQVMAIAKDSYVWIVANFKEGQIAHINVGQPVKVKVDAYSDTTYHGTVQSIAGATGSKFALLPPDNASGNFVKVEQRIPVKIVFNHADPKGPSGKFLKPGMNVKPTVDISKGEK